MDTVPTLADLQRLTRAWLYAVDNWTIAEHNARREVFDDYLAAIKALAAAPDVPA